MKLKQLLFTFCVLFFCVFAKAQNPDHTGAFITIWDTGKMAAGVKLSIPSVGSNYQYYWEKVGDEGNVNSGAYQNVQFSGSLSIPSIVAESGVYRLYIKGNYTMIILGNSPNSAIALVKVDSWGAIEWQSFQNAFGGCKNLTEIPLTAPDLSNVTDMSYMFHTTKLNQDLDHWDVKNVTNMSYMFYGASVFNGNISNWDVSKVTNMNNMFYGASSFNGNISSWDVGNVTLMNGMFSGTSAFNRDLNGWNVSKVTNMSSMFANASAFNGDIRSWNVANVINMFSMFKGAAAFNQNIKDWNVSNVTAMGAMFEDAIAFNGEVGGWNVSKATNMPYVFKGAISFDQNLGGWQFASGAGIVDMLSNSGLSVANYGLTLKGWAENVSTPTDLTLGAVGLTYESSAKQYRDMLVNDKGWTITDNGPATSALDHTGAFITTWDTGKLLTGNTLTIPSEGTNYQYYWEKVGEESIVNSGSYQITSGDLSLPAIAAGSGTYKIYIKGAYERVNMGSDSNTAKALTEVISWGDIVWKNMSHAFHGCENLSTLPVSAPDLSNVTNMDYMFAYANTFNGNLNGWDVSNVLSMQSMFLFAGTFNGDISGWDVSKVTNMASMFNNATSFNGDVSGWDVSNVTLMSSMFQRAIKFNGDISGWNVSKVTSMSSMFQDASIFNSNIGGWNVSGVTNTSGMFSKTGAFNQNLNNWDVSSVSSMLGMFYEASAFDQNLGAWQLNSLVQLNAMLNNSGLSAENYGLTLKGWAENVNTPSNRSLGATGLKYNAGAQQYRDILLNDKGWTIDDGGGLPVSLISFTAKAKENGIVLNWVTASESNNSHFVVEKGIDGFNFEYFGTTIAKGAGVYEVYDRSPIHGTGYYRLTQYDIDGVATLLGVQAVNFDMRAELSVNVYPNPVRSGVSAFVSFPVGVYEIVSIRDLAGKTISTTAINKQQGNISLETAGLQPGIYMIHLSGSLQVTKKLLVQ